MLLAGGGFKLWGWFFCLVGLSADPDRDHANAHGRDRACGHGRELAGRGDGLWGDRHVLLLECWRC